MNSLALRVFQTLVPKSLRPRSFAERALESSNEGRILAGPFKGMLYFPLGGGDAWHSRMIGTFELEIRDAIEKLIARGYDRVINVGAAEGYYAVGFATKLFHAQVVAFEMLTDKHPLIRQLADMNHVGSRVEVRGTCDADALRDAIGEHPDRCLIVIDVEGAEWELLDPVAIPSLGRASILIELHEHARPGLADELRRRFDGTHEIHRMPQRDRTQLDLPFKGGWLKPWLVSFIQEGRRYQGKPVRQEWWMMTPKI